MNLFYKIIIFLWLMTSVSFSQEMKSYKINIDYKAYWLGLTVADINSQTIVNKDKYQISARYNVSGFASLFNQSSNESSSRGIITKEHVFRPEYYESKGNFGKFLYSNEVSFDPDSLKVTNHNQKLTLRKDREYIPIAEAEKYGSDPLTIFLNMIMNENFNDDYKKLTLTRQFGGIFVSEQSFKCNDRQILKKNKRSRFTGEATICEIDGKLLAGRIKSTKPRKKRRKSRVDDDQKSGLWFGKMPGLNAMIPIYTEFPMGWGKVSIHIDSFTVEEIKTEL